MNRTAPYAFVFLRHGESLGNASGIAQGQADFDLTETGRLQAQALARRWEGEGRTFDRVISSPLTRARETAELIAAALGLSVELDPLWMERDNGQMAGLSYDQIRQRDLEAPFLHPYHHIGQTGESEFELYLRAGRAVQSLIDRGPGRYLVVSHGGILNKVLLAALGLPVQPNFYGASFRFDNSAFASLTYTPEEHRWAVLGLNDRAHWPGTEV
jgi:2,3-bisphosphoglycerate-dependent phosphoglycerate mutase